MRLANNLQLGQGPQGRGCAVTRPGSHRDDSITCLLCVDDAVSCAAGMSAIRPPPSLPASGSGTTRSAVVVDRD